MVTDSSLNVKSEVRDTSNKAESFEYETVAVIDIGTTSLRMAIAQIDQSRKIKVIEKLQQAVNLGKDTFTLGHLSKSTIEECVKALLSFQQVIREYRIENQNNIRAVATSAVREADNRDAFLDRIYIATGLEVEAVDEVEVSRLMYFTIEPILNNKEQTLLSEDTLVVEVGGGNTEMILLQSGNVAFSHTFDLGSFRMRQMLNSYQAPISSERVIMETYVERTISQMRQDVSFEKLNEIVALGGDARFAANQLVTDWNQFQVARIPLSGLSHLTDEILKMSVDELVMKYHLTYPAAESLGPALLSYVLLARSFKTNHLLISNLTLRDGLLNEMMGRNTQNEIFYEQTKRSALELGRKFNFDEPHSRHVSKLSVKIFKELQDIHNLAPRYQLILTVAAILHEVGQYIAFKNHHKHSMYLINNSDDLFGLSPKEIQFVALIARYHRGAPPKSNHVGYAELDRESRIIVCKLSAILRVADSLDQSHSARIKNVNLKRRSNTLILNVPKIADLSLEQMALNRKAAFFEQIYGVAVKLQKGSS